MSTKSVSKNITLKDKKLCQNFVSALESAEGKSSAKVNISKRVSDVKKEDLKSFFGRQ